MSAWGSYPLSRSWIIIDYAAMSANQALSHEMSMLEASSQPPRVGERIAIGCGYVRSLDGEARRLDGVGGTRSPPQEGGFSVRRAAASVMAVGLLALAACHPGPNTRDAGAGAAENWTAHNGDAAESAYSRLDVIKASNVSRLGLAWFMDLPGEASLEATPVAVGGVLYFTGSYGKVYAVDGQ